MVSPLKKLRKYTPELIRPLGVLALLASVAAGAQPVRTFVLGDRLTSWQGGGNGIDPITVLNPFAALVDTNNSPDRSIDFSSRPGWISPLFFDGQQNIAGRTLEGAGSVQAPLGGRGLEEVLAGTVNGDHLVAFERKPTRFEPRILIRGIRLVLDFAIPIGIQRVRFYPRNTVVETPSAPFHNDFIRGYEVWVNTDINSPATPDILVARDTENQQAVVDLAVPPQYIRFLMVKSVADVPFEIDEIEVYGTGYLNSGTYLSDLIDLGQPATIGAIRWSEAAVGDSAFSRLSVRVRSGSDDTPLLYRRNIYEIAEFGARNKVGEEEVDPETYFNLPREDRVFLAEDTQNWSPWQPVENNHLTTAPTPRRYLQLQLNFSGRLFDTRLVDQLEFDYLQPPVVDSLSAEVFPRLAQADEAATFRYALRLHAQDTIRGFDRLSIATNAPVENIRNLTINQEPTEFAVEASDETGFTLSFPLVRGDQTLIEFSFDLPIFRFGTTFSAQASNSRFPQVPHSATPGDVVDFGPGDSPELSGLSVAIPRPQIGKLVGEIALNAPTFTPNNDGINDNFHLVFNLLQLLRPTPVRLKIYDLAARPVTTLFDSERGIGPVEVTWNGRLGSSLAPPGNYIWVLEVSADAFTERHTGILAIAY